ncbi:MAG: elongation factor G [Anaerolineae bacterium]|nr:elongation factor G [Anaerolineae bacterium]
MSTYSPDKIRNVVLVGHSSSGKTTLAEAILFNTGALKRRGLVDDGNTVSDFDPEEIRRKISINTSVLPCEYQQAKINVLDAPGYLDFVGEVKGAIAAADTAIVVVDAVAGIEVGTELVWSYLDESNLPRVVFVNKMDRENANFGRVVSQLSDLFETRIIPFQLPIGSQETFQGVVDVIKMKAYLGEEGKEAEVPAELQEQANEYRQAIVEAAAESDDELIMKYLEGEELTLEEIVKGLRKRIAENELVGVFCGSALKNIGIRALMDAFVDYLPSPAERVIAGKRVNTGEEVELRADPNGPLVARVFKTTADPYVGKLSYFRVLSGTMRSDSRVVNASDGSEERIGTIFFMRGKEQIPTDEVGPGDIGAVAKLSKTTTGETLCSKDDPITVEPIKFPNPVYSVAIFPKTKADLDKMSSALARLLEEDPTLKVEREPGTGETIMSGMGDTHIDIAVRKLQAKFGLELVTDVPKVPYRETITKVASAQGRHKKQTGGRGQFGDVFIRFEPLERGAGFEFADEIFGGAVPKNYIPAVEKGLREIMEHGVLAGYPTVDFRAVLYDGSYHPVDSSELAFKLAAHLAFKKGIPEAGPVLLEPIMLVKVTVPEEYMGDVISDFNTRRGRVQGMHQEKGRATVTALVPLAEMLRYAIDLRGLTQGRGLFTMEFSHYDIVPSHIAQKIIEQAAKEKAENE